MNDPLLEESDIIPIGDITLEQPRDIPISELTAKAEELVQLDEDVLGLEKELSELKQVRKTVAEEHIPIIMETAGVDTLQLSDGKKIAIKEFVDARIQNPEKAFDWLRETNNESIIKNEIKIQLGRTEDDKAREIVETIQREFGIDADVKITIHNATLKAFCRDALEDPELAASMPREAFGIYQGKRAKVTK
jgi:hypothetical protein